MSDNDNGLIKLFAKTLVGEQWWQDKHKSIWRQSPNNARMGLLTFAIKVDGGGELLIDFEMPINEIVERTSDGFVGQQIGLTWRHTNPEWFLPLAKTFIRGKLDAMGYDFIESEMLAIKRTGIWG
jgi:hypothetical protein